MPRQLLPQAVWQTGHVDVIRRETILDKKSLTGDRIKSVMVDSAFVVDIDRLEDLQYAEYMLSKNNLDFDLPTMSGSHAVSVLDSRSGIGNACGGGNGNHRHLQREKPRCSSAL